MPSERSMVTEQIHSAVFCICCAALALSLAEAILPFERFEKQLRMIFSLVLMTALLRPLGHLHLPSLTYSPAEAASYAEEISERAAIAKEHAVAESVKNALNRTLAESHAPCSVSDVHLHIQSDGCIDISEVIISGNLLTGSVYLHELLGNEVIITEGGDALAGDD